MNSYELIKSSNASISSAYRKATIMELFNELIEHREKLKPVKFNVLGQVLQAKQLAGNKAISEIVASSIELLKKRQPSLIFDELKQLTWDLNNLNRCVATVKTSLIEDFTKYYESYLLSGNQIDVLRMMDTAKEIMFAFEMLKGTISKLKSNLQENVETQTEKKSLSILLKSDVELLDFANKLKALGIIYSELCMILDVSQAEYPIQIIKIESGSLLAKIFGESNVIKLMTDLIRSTLKYLYRNFTKEGKIVSIPKQAEAIEKIFNISKELKEQGIDVTKIEDNLRKGLVLISNELNALLIGQSAIELNEATISIGDEVEERYLTESKKLLLQQYTGNESDDDK